MRYEGSIAAQAAVEASSHAVEEGAEGAEYVCPLCRAKEPPQLPLTPQLERQGRRRARALSEKVDWVECEGPCAQWIISFALTSCRWVTRRGGARDVWTHSQTRSKTS